MRIIQAVLIGNILISVYSIPLHAMPVVFSDDLVVSEIERAFPDIDVTGIRAQADAADEVRPEYPRFPLDGAEDIWDCPVAMGTSKHVLDLFRRPFPEKIGAVNSGCMGSLPGFIPGCDDLWQSPICPGTPIRAPVAEPATLLLIGSVLISLVGLRGRTKE